MEGTLELAPLSGVGKQLDDALMHMVARATVNALAESTAKQLEGGVHWTR